MNIFFSNIQVNVRNVRQIDLRNSLDIWTNRVSKNPRLIP
jgi:hypothetical protein